MHITAVMNLENMKKAWHKHQVLHNSTYRKCPEQANLYRSQVPIVQSKKVMWHNKTYDVVQRLEEKKWKYTDRFSYHTWSSIIFTFSVYKDVYYKLGMEDHRVLGKCWGQVYTEERNGYPLPRWFPSSSIKRNTGSKTPKFLFQCLRKQIFLRFDPSLGNLVT